MNKFSPYVYYHSVFFKHLQVVYLSQVCRTPICEISKITGYANSTVRNYINKYSYNLELARSYFESPAEANEIEVEVDVEVPAPVPQVLYRKFRDGRSVPMELMPGYGEDISNEQIVYFFKFFSADDLLFDKIGTTTKNAISRLRDEIGEYSKKFPISKVEVHRIRSCNGIPAEGYESALRGQLIADHPTAFRKNDRFFGADIPASVFDAICDQFAKTCEGNL